MCGIAGIYYFDRRARVDPLVLRRMVDAIAHRGPDDRGFFIQGGVGLGMCRLSVIDVNGGQQPASNEDGNIIAFQNGEIYNYQHLTQMLRSEGHTFRTKSDTEVLPHLYEHLGKRFAPALHGMFAAAVFDQRDRCLVLTRDRIGEKPLFIYADDDRLVFASEIKAILASGFVHQKLNARAFRQYLGLNYVPAPLTIFEGIVQLLPGHTMTLKDRAIETTCYWKLGGGPESRHNAADVEAEFRPRLLDAVSERMIADVPVGLFLSGGLDSSAIAWAASEVQTRPLHSFSMAFPGYETDETESATLVARHFGTLHTVLASDVELLDLIPQATRSCDQPHGDLSFLPLYRLCHEARKSVTVCLTGDGADEIFGGYSWHRGGLEGSFASMAERRAAFNGRMVFSSKEQLDVLSDEIRPAVADADPLDVIDRIYQESASLDHINRLLYLDLKLLLSGNNLVKTDRMAMAHGLEIRPPFLDHRLIEFAFTIPGKQKVGLRGKETVRRAMTSRIPEMCINKPKQMFHVPAREWYRRDADRILRDVLLNERMRDRQLLDSDAMTRIIIEHQAGTADHTRKIRALIAFDSWCRLYIDTHTSVAST